MKLESAPPNWHFAVNLPVAIVWMLGIPIGACLAFQISLLWIILIAPLWSLITGRITDRWIPGLTGPVIDKIYFRFGGERKSSAPLKPESDYSVETTDDRIRSTRPDRTMEEILWEALTGVDVETNSLGPFVPDVFWILHAGERSLVFPQGASGDGDLLVRFQEFPDFDHEVFIAAMSSTTEATFKVWRRT